MNELKERNTYEITNHREAPAVYTSGREDRRNRRKAERRSQRKKIKPLV
jgi:hypothetical protein